MLSCVFWSILTNVGFGVVGVATLLEENCWQPNVTLAQSTFHGRLNCRIIRKSDKVSGYIVGLDVIRLYCDQRQGAWAVLSVETDTLKSKLKLPPSKACCNVTVSRRPIDERERECRVEELLRAIVYSCEQFLAQRVHNNVLVDGCMGVVVMGVSVGPMWSLVSQWHSARHQWTLLLLLLVGEMNERRCGRGQQIWPDTRFAMTWWHRVANNPYTIEAIPTGCQ